MQDFEFTIEDGTLYMLQTRTGKRTTQAAVKIAVDMVARGPDHEGGGAPARRARTTLDQLLHPRIDPKDEARTCSRKGLAASPGAAVGEVVFDAGRGGGRPRGANEGRSSSATRPTRTTSTGMDAAQGILTATGGMTSHAAVVARGMGKCCVAGCSAIESSTRAQGYFEVGGRVLAAGRRDHARRLDRRGAGRGAATLEPEDRGRVQDFMGWADEVRRLCACAPTPTSREDAAARPQFGARASASAAPSTCSSPRSASRGCSR